MARVMNPGMYEGIRAPKTARALTYVDLSIPASARAASAKVTPLPGRYPFPVPVVNQTNMFYPMREVLPRQAVLGWRKSVNGTTSDVMGMRAAGFMTRGEKLTPKDVAYDARFRPRLDTLTITNFGPFRKKKP